MFFQGLDGGRASAPGSAGPGAGLRGRWDCSDPRPPAALLTRGDYHGASQWPPPGFRRTGSLSAKNVWNGGGFVATVHLCSKLKVRVPPPEPSGGGLPDVTDPALIKSSLFDGLGAKKPK